MRKALVLYTVLLHKEGFPVSYIDQRTWRVRRLTGPFADPGEAAEEFKATIGGEAAYYLAPQPFSLKAAALRKRKREKAKRKRRIARV
jgi:hypothetical protein